MTFLLQCFSSKMLMQNASDLFCTIVFETKCCIIGVVLTLQHYCTLAHKGSYFLFNAEYNF